MAAMTPKQKLQIAKSYNKRKSPAQSSIDFEPMLREAVPTSPRKRQKKKPFVPKVYATAVDGEPRAAAQTANLLNKMVLSGKGAALLETKEQDVEPPEPARQQVEDAEPEHETDSEVEEASADSPDQQRDARSVRYTDRIRERLQEAGLDVQEVDTFDANGERTLVVRLNDTVSDSALVKVSEIGVKLKKKRPAIAFLPPRHKWVMAFMSLHEAALGVRSDKITNLSFVRMHWHNRGFSLEPLDGLSALDTFIGHCTVVRDVLRAHSASSSSGGKRPGLRPAAVEVEESKEEEKDDMEDSLLGQSADQAQSMADAAVAAASSYSSDANAAVVSGPASAANSPMLNSAPSILPSGGFALFGLDMGESARMAAASVAYAAAEATGGLALMNLSGAQLDSAGPQPPPVMAAAQPYIPPVAQDQPADVSLD